MDQFYLLINEWIGGGLALAALGCFLWGVVSVLFSPCHLASIPLIVGYVGGQNEPVHGRRAVAYALLFSFGLFVTIALVGIVCAMLGRMLGDVPSWWTILVGLVLLWVALDMLGVARCSMSGSLMGRLRLRGLTGALVLGLAYGVLSGSCTFGFIAPILAIILVQERVASGMLLIILFGIGHCLPILLAGSSTAWVRRVLSSSAFGSAGQRFRRLAGATIGLLGVYFIALPFFD
ncbi:MAG: sulfite exporter TauE/SafE family protein [Pseudodesulfovibrio sp.]|uniref:Cytochrome c biogenesis protein transmembrane region n=1 Tax=Pseudodesulfovibrio aespoeensis (strain ATCC 700646 / DSM 10631 / Aspo-2) TaxID=643562 RepID=E6VXS0_PSEA9|nr:MULTISPECIES: cytochrome c biogenesis protein CcdA [Pseudodesulfovibrio]MBU4193346.1 sulfite exporter TauE/SafE family protein [Pseudomonadota bacterium]MBV1737510.1 sulfite exporter TauE/SafE family protein [Desulfarculus sp.]ADU61528.1 cytochrome c biogenesis protein transmembrane region [Pseudodesulfovibrio aespoeensis Aspo-2]MBU4379070.1 sulfite exporter TauE/SafE family protein [Pseudomonadota bacterium]MBU4474543.1 sulfite exporter TauE/SafE family protein [Pseudomonadota bacterium]